MQRKSNAYKNTCACGLGLNLCMCALTEKRWDTIVSHVVIKTHLYGAAAVGDALEISRQVQMAQCTETMPESNWTCRAHLIKWSLYSTNWTLQVKRSCALRSADLGEGAALVAISRLSHWPRYRSPSVSHSLSVLVLATTDHFFGTGSVQNQEPQTFWIWQTGE